MFATLSVAIVLLWEGIVFIHISNRISRDLDFDQLQTQAASIFGRGSRILPGSRLQNDQLSLMEMLP